MPTSFTLTSKIIIYPGMNGWRFLFIPKDKSSVIKKTFGKRAVGWGSIRTTVTIGKTTWNTSIFPDKKSGGYLLPLKAQVRRKESLDDGSLVRFTIKFD